jgi:hypothetical protein
MHISICYGACLCLLHALFNLAHGRSNQPLFYWPFGADQKPNGEENHARPEAAAYIYYACFYLHTAASSGWGR